MIGRGTAYRRLRNLVVERHEPSSTLYRDRKKIKIGNLISTENMTVIKHDRVYNGHVIRPKLMSGDTQQDLQLTDRSSD